MDGHPTRTRPDVAVFDYREYFDKVKVWPHKAGIDLRTFRVTVDQRLVSDAPTFGPPRPERLSSAELLMSGRVFAVRTMDTPGGLRPREPPGIKQHFELFSRKVCDLCRHIDDGTALSVGFFGYFSRFHVSDNRIQRGYQHGISIQRRGEILFIHVKRPDGTLRKERSYVAEQLDAVE